MYRLLSGLYQHLTRKEEYTIIILGLDQSGKTTLLEKIKTIYNPNQPGLKAHQISKTIGQNIGRIVISSSGGSKEIRSIWEKYFKEIDGLCWVLDSNDRFQNSFPSTSTTSKTNINTKTHSNLLKKKDERMSQNKGKSKMKDDEVEGVEEEVEVEEEEIKSLGQSWIELKKVLNHPSILESKIPILIIANKQDLRRKTSQKAESKDTIKEAEEEEEEEEEDRDPMRVEEVKEIFNRLVIESDRSEKSRSLGITEAHVIGVSALNGDGIREAMNWLFYRIASKSSSRKTLNAQFDLNQFNSTSNSSNLTNSNPPTQFKFHHHSNLKNHSYQT
ncbi:P-loop containing nucleoside triphosphate hydrolase protein [Melampsora americana]|nr:P-loop containing nucleoside triphosphate hydrolase protein [Melampsora americana]